MIFTSNMPPEVVAVIAQNPALQKFYESEYLKAEAAAQDALNEQQRLAQKQQELDELRRKNDIDARKNAIEEERNAEIMRQGARIEQLFSLTTDIMDAYIAKHHEPLYGIMQAVLTQLGLILQSQNIILPELLKRMDDPRLANVAAQIMESLRKQAQPQDSRGSTIIYAGDAPTNVHAPGSNINKMHIGDH